VSSGRSARWPPPGTHQKRLVDRNLLDVVGGADTIISAATLRGATSATRSATAPRNELPTSTRRFTDNASRPRRRHSTARPGSPPEHDRIPGRFIAIAVAGRRRRYEVLGRHRPIGDPGWRSTTVGPVTSSGGSTTRF